LGQVSHVAWLRTADTHLTRTVRWIRVGYKGGKTRDLDLVNDARHALDQYLATRQDQAPCLRQPKPDEFVLASQRHERLTEAGIHHWLRALKRCATKAEWDLIAAITYHDLRHDFAHRARSRLEPRGGRLLHATP
jgi:site-specific recombinase XerD